MFQRLLARLTGLASARTNVGRFLSWHRPLAAALLAIGWSVAPQAHAQHAGDILLASTPTGQLTTLGVRVYSAEFDPLELGEYVASNPGMDRATVYPAGYGTLPGRTALSFLLEPFGPAAAPMSTLWFWNGDGSIADFAPLTNGTQFKVLRGGNTAIAEGGTDPVPGFSLGTTSLTGGIHVHPFYAISRTPGGDPAAGIYAVAMSFSMPGRTASDPVFLLFATPDLHANALPLATAWAEGVAAIPEPESIALLLAGSVLVAWRVRPARARCTR